MGHALTFAIVDTLLRKMKNAHRGIQAQRLVVTGHVIAAMSLRPWRLRELGAVQSMHNAAAVMRASNGLSVVFPYIPLVTEIPLCLARSLKFCHFFWLSMCRICALWTAVH